jgi:hypothetical protein
MYIKGCLHVVMHSTYTTNLGCVIHLCVLFCMKWISCAGVSTTTYLDQQQVLLCCVCLCWTCSGCYAGVICMLTRIRIRIIICGYQITRTQKCTVTILYCLLVCGYVLCVLWFTFSKPAHYRTAQTLYALDITSFSTGDSMTHSKSLHTAHIADSPLQCVLYS